MKKALISLIFFMLPSLFCFSQQADKVTEAINTRQATFGQAAYFFTVAAQACPETIEPEDALNVLKNIDAVKNDVNATDPINLQEISWIIAKYWNLEEGSLMLKLFPSPRYAFRQARAKGLFNREWDPARIPDGHELLNIVFECIRPVED